MKRKYCGVVAAVAALGWLGACKERTASSSNPPTSADETRAADEQSKATSGENAQYFEGNSRGNSGDVVNPLLGGVNDAEKAKYEAWFSQHQINPEDSAALDTDLDADGYSNREEFLAETNPRDGTSAPGLLNGTTMKQFNEVAIPVVLRAVKDNQARIEHEDRSISEVREGSTLKGLPYKITKVKHEEKPDKHGVLTDMSRVELENLETKEKVLLVRDLPARSVASNAVVVGPDGDELTLRMDQIFSLKSMPGKTFQVIDLRPEQVVVQDTANKQVLTIPRN